MRRTLSICGTFLAVLFVVVGGCSKGVSTTPTAMALGGDTPTATLTWTPFITPTPNASFTPPPGLFCGAGISDSHVDLILSINGAPETTAAVTLNTPGGPIGLVSSTPSSTDFLAHYFNPAGSITYQPGWAYTLTVQTSVGSAAATVTAPGGLAIAPDGSSASWAYEGNYDFIYVLDSNITVPFTYDSLKLTSDLASPATIPATAYPHPGTYEFRLFVNNSTQDFPGAASGSVFSISTELIKNITR